MFTVDSTLSNQVLISRQNTITKKKPVTVTLTYNPIVLISISLLFIKDIGCMYHTHDKTDTYIFIYNNINTQTHPH